MLTFTLHRQSGSGSTSSCSSLSCNYTNHWTTIVQQLQTWSQWLWKWTGVTQIPEHWCPYQNCFLLHSFPLKRYYSMHKGSCKNTFLHFIGWPVTTRVWGQCFVFCCCCSFGASLILYPMDFARMMTNSQSLCTIEQNVLHLPWMFQCMIMQKPESARSSVSALSCHSWLKFWHE